ncbi:MAG: TrkA family potassium uptake protein [Clostridia bacterium]
MKSILVIGMGKFGTYLATKLQELNNDILVIDNNPLIIEELASKFPNAQIGDCTKPEVLETLDIPSFDVCFVAIDENFQSSLEITSLLSEMGAKCVVSKASRGTQEKFLKRNGATEVVFPDKDIAERMAVRYSANNIYDCIHLSGDHSIYELPINELWVGKTIQIVDVRKIYGINILAIKQGDNVIPSPLPSYIFKSHDHIIVLGKQQNVLKLDSKLG